MPPFSPTHWQSQAETPDDVVARLKSGMNLFIHGAAATPTPLLEALARRSDLENVRLWHLHLEGPVPFDEPALDGQ